MSESVKNKWDRIYSQQDHRPNNTLPLLTENAYLLPKSGNALDLACGLGDNALFLAKHGLITDAWDISSIALQKLSAEADRQKCNITTRQYDIDETCLMNCAYDVIVVTRFLDRSLVNAIINALNAGGLLFYQTFTQDRVVNQGPRNPDFLLSANELLELFSPLGVVFYRENGMIGDRNTGLRNEAQFIGLKS